MRTQSRGFSLVEVLIATTITVVALASLAQMFVLAAAANRASRSRTLATILARDKMEDLLYDESEAGTGMDFIDAHGEWLGDTTEPPGTAFVRRWSILPGTGFLERSRLLVIWIAPPEGPELVRLVGAREGRAP